MRFGICAGFEHVPVLKRLGYDYIEGNLTAVSRMNAEELTQTALLLRANGILMEAANCFFPPEVKLCGDNMERGRIREYTLHALENAVQLGMELAVLGSGKARRIPEGFDSERAHGQLLEALGTAGEAAWQYGVVIALEPLNRDECNQVNTLAQAAALAKELNAPNVRVNVDLYHMVMEGEPFSVLSNAADQIAHVHFNRPFRPRTFPAFGDGYEYHPFAQELRRAGYNARVSIEAGSKDFVAEADASLSIMWHLFQKV